MREILFRGKRLDNREWVEGFYQASPSGNHYITSLCAGGAHPDKVAPSTICQFTGMTDNVGQRIFEGDIVNVLPEDDELGVIEWSDSEAMFVLNAENFRANFYNYFSTDVEVVGSIHDAPELLGGAKNA